MDGVREYAVVVGASRGLGLALCEELHRRGYEVSAVCRSSENELASSSAISFVGGCDITSVEGVDKMIRHVGARAVNILIINAGVLNPDTLATFSASEAMHHFHVNSIAPVILSQTLAPRLAQGARLGLITGRMGSIQDTAQGGRPEGCYAYRMSKSALCMAGTLLHRDLQGQGISVRLLDPGKVASDLSSRYGSRNPDGSPAQGWQSPDEAAQVVLNNLFRDTLDTSDLTAAAATTFPLVNIYGPEGLIRPW